MLAHRRPEQQRTAAQHQHGRQQCQQQRVIDHVHGPHAARDAPHDRPGEVVRVPVRGEPLHPPEGIGGHARHEPQREPDDRPQREIPHRREDQPQHRHRQNRRNSGVQCSHTSAGVPCYRIHQPAGIDRQQQVGAGRQSHAGGDRRHTPRLASPVAHQECENVAHHVIGTSLNRTAHRILKGRAAGTLGLRFGLQSMCVVEKAATRLERQILRGGGRSTACLSEPD